MALPLSFPALPLLDVETALRHLPAEVRARVAWAKRPIQNVLARLRDEALTDELIAEAARATWKPLASFGQVFWEIVGSNVDEWRARLSDDFRLEEQQLAAFLDEDDARDTLRWVIGLLHSFVSLGLSVPPEYIRQIDDGVIEQLGSDADLQLYLRGMVALMAASQTRKAGGDPQRARDLLDVAFLELTKFRAALRRHGVFLTPFPNETVEERRRGLLESAARLRESLSDDDWRILEQARMRNLR